MRSRLRRLQRAARGDLDHLDLRDGSRYFFEPMEAHKALFLEQANGFRALAVEDLSEGPYEPPRDAQPAELPGMAELRTALAKATPESLARFEARYGPAEPECGVIHGDGSVTVCRMSLDGTVSATVLEGEEAERIRWEARGESYP